MRIAVNSVAVMWCTDQKALLTKRTKDTLFNNFVGLGGEKLTNLMCTFLESSFVLDI